MGNRILWKELKLVIYVTYWIKTFIMKKKLVGYRNEISKGFIRYLYPVIHNWWLIIFRIITKFWSDPGRPQILNMHIENNVQITYLKEVIKYTHHGQSLKIY